MIGSPGANNNYAFFGNKVRNTIFFQFQRLDVVFINLFWNLSIHRTKYTYFIHLRVSVLFPAFRVQSGFVR